MRKPHDDPTCTARMNLKMLYKKIVSARGIVPIFLIAALAGVAFLGSLSGFSGAGFAASPSTTETQQEADDDATYVVDKLITQKSVAMAFTALAPVLRSSMVAMFRNPPGADMSEVGKKKLVQVFLTKMQASFLDRMRDGYITVYRETFSAETLKSLRAFLDTPAGQEYADKQGEILKKSSEIGRTVGGIIGLHVVKILKRELKSDEEGAKMFPNPKDLEIARQMFPS